MKTDPQHHGTTRKTGKIVLHIGLPKAASTYLQRRVFPKLAEGGIQFRGKTSNGGWQQDGLWRNVRSFCLGGDVSRRDAALEELSSSNGGQIFSSEDFLNPFAFRPGSLVPMSLPTFERIDRFVSIAPDNADLAFLIVLRRQEDWLASFHFECLRQGYSTRVDQHSFWQEIGVHSRWASDVLDYSNLFEALQSRYPSARVHGVLMEEMVSAPIEVLGPVIDFLGYRGAMPSVDIARENNRASHDMRSFYTRTERGFMHRRLALQVLSSDLTLRERISRLGLMFSNKFGPLRHSGLPAATKDDELVKEFRERNRHFASSTGRSLSLREHGYLGGVND